MIIISLLAFLGVCEIESAQVSRQKDSLNETSQVF